MDDKSENNVNNVTEELSDYKKYLLDDDSVDISSKADEDRKPAFEDVFSTSDGSMPETVHNDFEEGISLGLDSISSEGISMSSRKNTSSGKGNSKTGKSAPTGRKHSQNSKNTGRNVFLGFLCSFAALMAVATLFLLVKMNMLPAKFVALAAGAVALLIFIIFALMFMPSKHKFGKRKIAATVLSVVTILGCGTGIFFMTNFMETLDTVLVSKDKAFKKEQLDDPFIVYISGSDTRDNQLDENSRSDVNILAVVNPVTRQVLLLNTPRDYYVENPAYNNGMDKLTHCGIDGIDNSMTALEKLYGIKDIDYYCRINFTGFEKLVDSIGGIDFYSDVAFTTEATSNVHINKGENHLNGFQALAVARERHAFASGDFARGENQMKIIKAILSKITSSDVLVKNYLDIMKSLQGMFETDVPQLLIQNTVKKQLEDSSEWNIKSFAVTGRSDYAVCVTSGQSLSVVFRDEKSVEKAKALIKQVQDGEAIDLE